MKTQNILESILDKAGKKIDNTAIAKELGVERLILKDAQDETVVRQYQQIDGEVVQMQALISSGEVWKFEGSMGREAMRLLEIGACFLPARDTRDYWGNLIPSRLKLKPGTKGTLLNSLNFWSEQA